MCFEINGCTTLNIRFQILGFKTNTFVHVNTYWVQNVITQQNICLQKMMFYPKSFVQMNR